jgi:hypothetical protein
MTHKEMIQQIDEALKAVMKRSAHLRAAAEYYSRYLTTDDPGLEHQLCAELYMALCNAIPGCIPYVEFPGNRSDQSPTAGANRAKGNCVEKIDLFLEHDDKVAYIEVKVGRSLKSEVDINKLKDLVGEAAAPLCICIHFNSTPDGMQVVEACFRKHCHQLDQTQDGSIERFADGRAYLVRYAFWAKQLEQSAVDALKTQHASLITNQNSMSSTHKRLPSKIYRDGAEKERLTGKAVERPSRQPSP